MRFFEFNNFKIDPAVVRGLEYYTGPIFEAELTFKVKNEKGIDIEFGSIGGGGRYDDLVKRFKNTRLVQLLEFLLVLTVYYMH